MDVHSRVGKVYPPGHVGDGVHTQGVITNTLGMCTLYLIKKLF